jgi:hypothetical protein
MQGFLPGVYMMVNCMDSLFVRYLRKAKMKNEKRKRDVSYSGIYF